MARVLITDQNYEDLALERELFGNAGMELAVAQCTTEEMPRQAGTSMPFWSSMRRSARARLRSCRGWASSAASARL
jgi:hypothetical protein